jgi:hypothetical protein
VRRPSPATVIAVIALVVAMSGGAYAALRPAKNSVTSRSIRNGQVKTADLANGAVNSAKVADGSLESGDLAQGALAPEATIPITPNPLGSTDPCETGQVGIFCGIAAETPTPSQWVNAGGGFAEGGYYRDGEGVVHLSGLVKAAYPTRTQRIFTLPPGYRPAATHAFSTGCWTFSDMTPSNYFPCPVAVQSDGGVVELGGGKYPTSGLILDGISFRAG